MCGIIGIVMTGPDVGSWPDLAGALESGGPPASGLVEAAASSEDLVDQLFCFPAFRRLFERPEDRRLVRSLSRRLDEAARACSEQARRHPLGPDREDALRAAGRYRDMAWRLDRDLLPNLEKVAALAGGPEVSSGRLFHLWQVNALLNGIDRLEVRGRDSAGLTITVSFPDETSYEAALRPLADRVGARCRDRDFAHGALRRAPAAPGRGPSLTFAFKVAREIGELGDNVAALRLALQRDDLLHRVLDVPGVRSQPLAHTRWASNGVISEPNCHPVDNSLGPDAAAPRSSDALLVAALNGDVDNYQDLRAALADERGWSIGDAVTTDAKVIPLVVDQQRSTAPTLEEAFRAAAARFEGSFAIALLSTDEPDTVLLAQRGSGQSLYVGFIPGGFLFASELYGLVELTRSYIKLDGETERVPGRPETAGEMAVLRAGWDRRGAALDLYHLDGTAVDAPLDRMKQAEITTRDIDRRGYDHYLLKEITESVESVRKTLEGKVDVRGERVLFPFVENLFPESLCRALAEGAIRRIVCVGQGTAAIAGQAVAALMSSLLARSALEVRAFKATELSGFALRPDMKDTLVVAISQSGTTTDTNRTVDLVRQRGAQVLAIVNRRGSDLVFKADAVFYTSDGRDVEMSVASTKAFYAQVTAGTLVALALAQLLGCLPDREIRCELAHLERLPSLIGEILEDHEPIAAAAHRHAIRHRHWAVVGNGLNRVAADEIRIKLSELCYKSIACDHTEDKKHIDLSAEPLIVVCAAGLRQTMVTDVVKEVAIFRAHKATPIVIATAGERRFDPYAAEVLTVPGGAGRLSFVLTTVVGHLWGYYAARAHDEQARRLRALRARSLELFRRLESATGGVTLESLVHGARAALGPRLRDLEEGLAAGDFNSGLPASMAIRLALITHAMTGRMSFDGLVHELGGSGRVGAGELFDAFLAGLTQAINHLSRPIDAIKHQAKTVTVGISRAERPAGLLFDALLDQGQPLHRILPSHLEILDTLCPLIERVTGAVIYRIDGLDRGGEPHAGTRITVLQKTGIAAAMTSRADRGAPLVGSKWLIALERRVYMGVGRSDGRLICMVPLVEGETPWGIALFHIAPNRAASLEERLRALRAYRSRYEQLVGCVTELDREWRDDLVLRIPIEDLFETSVERVVSQLYDRRPSQTEAPS